jgi:hypothetical protein
LDDPSEYLCKLARKRSLPEFSGRFVVPTMMLLLDSNDTIRLGAIQRLFKATKTAKYHELMCGKGMIPSLFKLFSDPNDEIRKCAVLTLYNFVIFPISDDAIKAADGITHLVRAVSDPVMEIRNYVIDMLFHLKYFGRVPSREK